MFVTHRVGSTEAARAGSRFRRRNSRTARGSNRSSSGGGATSGARLSDARLSLDRRCPPMCGIAGVLDRSGAHCAAATPAPDERCHRASRPGRRGPVRRRPGRPGQPAPRDHRPVRRGHSRWPRATGRFVITYNGEIYNFRELAPSSSARAIASARAPTPRWSLARLRAVGRGCVERFNGMFALAIWDRERAGAVPRARPLRHQAALLRRGRAAAHLRLGDQVAARARALSARAEPAAPARVLHLPEHLHRRHAVRGRQAASRRAPPAPCAAGGGTVRARALLGLRLPRARWQPASARGVRGGARPALPPGRRAPARQRRPGRRLPQRRHGLGLDHRARGAGRCRTSTPSPSAST